MDAATGRQLWKTFVTNMTNNLIGVSVNAPYTRRSSPTVVDGKVYVGALDGNLYVFNANSGSILWKITTKGPVFASPTIVGNAVYFTSSTGSYYPQGQGPAVQNGTIYKVDASSGNIIWQKIVPYCLNRTAGSGANLLASVIVEDGLVFVRSGIYLNYALNATTGDTIWTYEARYNPGTPFQSGGVIQLGTPLYKYGKIYMNDFYGIVALNANNASEAWFTYLSRESSSSGINYAYGRIYVVTEAGVLYVLDALTGEKLSYYEFGNLQLRSTPTPYNGSLYVGANDFNLYCFEDARFVSTVEPEPTPTPSQPTSSSAQTTAPSSTLPAQTQTPAASANPTSTPVTPVPSASQQPETNSPNTTFIVGVVIAVIVIIVVVAAVFLLRRRK